MSDLIDRQAAIDALNEKCMMPVWCKVLIEKMLKDLPSAQPEHDIPIKPKETTDRTWGIQSRQAVCPKCDYYLSNFVFLGDGKGKRVTYCEHCGQAIDWEGWDVDE